MAEPTAAIIKAYDAATSLFWNATPLTRIIGNLLGSDSEESGTFAGDLLGYLIKALGASEGLSEALKGASPGLETKIAGMLVRMGLSAEDAQGFTQYLTNLELGSPIIDLIVKGSVGIATALKMTGAVLQVADLAILKTINRKASLQPGDFDSLYRASLIHSADTNFDDIVKDLGLNESWLKAMLNGREQILGPAEIAEAYRRGIYGKEEASARLRMNGYIDVNQRVQLLSLTEQLTPVDTAIELLRRGDISKDTAVEFMGKHGYTKQTIDNIIDTSKPLFGLSEIVPLYIKGYMSPEETKERLSKHGYSGTEMKYITQLGKHPLTEDQLLRLRWRDFINDDDFMAGLQKLGYEDIDSARIRKILYTPASPSDMIRFAVREVWSPDVATKFELFSEFPEQFAVEAKKVGIAPETAKEYWAAHWDLPAPGQGFDMYHRGIIDADELKMLLRALDVNPFWRERLIKLNDRLIPRRQLRQLLETEVETPKQVAERYHKLGYSKEDAFILTSVDIIKLAEEEKDITKTEAINGYVYSILSEQELREALAALFYSLEAIDYYVKEAKRKKALNDAKEDVVSNEDQLGKAMAVLTQDIISEYQAGMIAKPDAVDMLMNIGYYKETVDYFLSHAELDQLKQDLTFYAKHIKALFEALIIDPVEAQRQLTEKGYNVEAASTMVAKWEFERVSEESVAAARVIEPTKADMKRWTKKAIISAEEYDTYLESKGYSEYARLGYLTELMYELETGTETS